jgi:hypothetical protein
VPPVMSVMLVSSAGDRRRVGYTFALGLRSGDGTSRGWVRCRLGRGSLLFGLRFLGPGRESLVLEQGSLELRGGSLKLVRRRSCSALSVVTWRERSSISYRSSVLLGSKPRLASADWGATSEMPSAQRAVASKLH